MYVAVCRLELRIPSAQTLKDKRQVIKSILSRMKNKNISVAETGRHDSHQTAEIGFALVSHHKDTAEEICRKTVDFIEDNYPVELLSVEMEIN